VRNGPDFSDKLERIYGPVELPSLENPGVLVGTT
jgi:hypothetical protein